MSSQLRTELKRSKYRLLGLVGQGQFGRVYCAVHRQTGRLVALKNLEQQRFPTHKFLRELRFLLSLQHPNIVTCQALEHTATGRYLVMDYCEGGTLRSLMSEDSSPSLAQSLKLIADILAGLEHAHSRGIVHCDIKPENILLNFQSAGWTARISDFGIAKLSQELTAQEPSNTGSPAYMAPERFYGQYSPTSDLYSVGVMLFELLAGYRPFSGTPLELMSAHLNCPVKLPETIPAIWQPLVLTALQKLSARRFHSAKDMLAALKAIAKIEGSGSWLDPQALTLPLLQLKVSPPLCPFQFEQQESLPQRVDCLALSTPLYQESSPLQLWSYQARETQVIVMSQASAGLTKICEVVLPTRVKKLVSHPQGCLAITQDVVYFLPNLPGASPQPIALLNPHDIATSPTSGHWLAIASVDSSGNRTLSFQPLASGRSQSLAIAPIQLSPKRQPDQLLQVVALDACHVAVASALPGKSQDELSSGTLFEMFTRRGDRVGSLVAAIALGRAVPTCTPYRLLATDRRHPQSLLLIDLKPFRILRLGIAIIPELLTAAPWGYSATDSQGQMVLLDIYGQVLSQIQLPETPTAIVPSHPSGFLIATWQDERGQLYTVDLKNLNLDLVL